VFKVIDMNTIMTRLQVTALAGALAFSVGAAEPDTTAGDFNLSFAGGTPKALLEAMEKASGQKVNALIPENLADTRVPKFELRSVTANAVFGALDALMQQNPEDQAGRWLPIRNVWVLTGKPDTRETRVFFVGDLLTRYKIDDLTTAIQSAWQLSSRNRKPELNYHQETQLLMVLAGKTQLEIMKDVLGEMERGLASAPAGTGSEKTGKGTKPPAPQKF
jgi:hypothetical protein